ncbi:hypothetical protein ASPCADRAFT_397846 [Aspergillus carbonarius ITEM 5010]|uniref:Uncharacterized protein n=1 Tax=Aspergillus carbonarius (strain ITEM 5010) TaxID=602072 RepID=A0A1R3RI77_ASPC5|nr:hypothetical protein ASPCADRAFT_397846 [Aspergillus carbonarius ITEM 5010]
MSSQGPIGKLAHGVTSSIGFVSEVHGYRKAKKAARKERELEGQQLPSPSQSPPPDIAYHRGEQHRAPPAEATAHDEVERTWQLDEAQDALVERPTPHKSKGGVANPDKVIAAFLQRRPPPDAFSAVPDGVDPRPRLTYPVAIPQRRPKDKSRGFIHAYALELQTLGIDQDTWFDFIDTFSEASLANPWINALNLASLATSPLPSLISTAISTAIMVATTVAIETQGRYRQNKALDRLNDEFFRPRGLYCLVMTWDPTSFSARTNVDVTTTIQNTINTQGKMSHKFQSSNGVTNGMESIQTAELIFPGLDYLATATKDEQKGFKKKMERGKGFLDDYMDRRAQAKFVAENPTSHLTQAGKPKFASKFADPTHSMHTFLSGGMRGGAHPNRGLGRGGMGWDRGLGGRGGGGGLLGLVNIAAQAVNDHRQQKADAANRGNSPAPYGGDDTRPYEERERHQQYPHAQASGTNPRFYEEHGQYQHTHYEQAGGANPRYYNEREGQQPHHQPYQQSYQQPHQQPSQQPYQQRPYQQQPYQQQQYQQFSAGAGAGAGGLSLKKLFGSKVLYLMVVNMPTEEEMAQAQRLTAHWNI